VCVGALPHRQQLLLVDLRVGMDGLFGLSGFLWVEVGRGVEDRCCYLFLLFRGLLLLLLGVDLDLKRVIN
jgi:hypothetical protein